MQTFCFADRNFYETASRWVSETGSFTVLDNPVPDGWVRGQRGVWVGFSPEGHKYPDQGWKIHASAVLDNADLVCTAIWEYCIAKGVPFKLLSSANVLLAHSAKYAPRGSSGKLATIYPRDERETHTILTELGGRLDGEPNPYILSDLRWGDGPLYVRYGGFVEKFCNDEEGDLTPAIRRPDGKLVPDRRRPVFTIPPWVGLPDFLAPHVAARSNDSGATMPYRILEALHFSNCGGVYRAERLTDGCVVVLKEARPLVGFDTHRDDAITRLAREKWALQQLAGIDGIPECYDSFELDGHHFVAMEFVEGQHLQGWQARRHPLVITEAPTEAEVKRYTRDALDLMERLQQLLDAVHDRGVIFGDLHPGNVIVRPDGSVALIDFELAFDAARDRYRPGLAAPGFAAGPETTGPAVDDYAMAALRLCMFMPLPRVLALAPAKTRQHLDAAERRFPLPADYVASIRQGLGLSEDTAPGIPRTEARTVASALATSVLGAPGPGWTEMRKSIVDGILASATPDRADRLFPGDFRLFSNGGLGFVNGATGVLWALSTTGCGRFPEYEQWLLDSVRRGLNPRPGFFDGMHGIAYVLRHLGYDDVAAQVLDQALAWTAQLSSMNLSNGLAGVGLNLLHFVRYAGRTDLRGQVHDVTERLSDAVRTGLPFGSRTGGSAMPKPVKAGLQRGWSGPALFFVRRFEESGDPVHLDLAVQALHRDLDLCQTAASGACYYEEAGVRLSCYLEVGSAGIAVVTDELLRHRPDERLLTALPHLALACSSEFVIQSTLFTGRAGLLATLCRIFDRVPTIDPGRIVNRHLDQFRLHAVDLDGHLAFPGNQSLRLSMDLATGGAGILVGMSTAFEPETEFFPFFSSRKAPRKINS